MNKPKHCPGKECFERINYLYQLSNITLKKSTENTTSALYSNLLLSISKKSVQRIEPDIKRTICKKCHSLMVTGITAKVRIKKKRVRYTCLKCNTAKVLKVVPGYLPWVWNPQAVVETLKY